MLITLHFSVNSPALVLPLGTSQITLAFRLALKAILEMLRQQLAEEYALQDAQILTMLILLPTNVWSDATIVTMVSRQVQGSAL